MSFEMKLDDDERIVALTPVADPDGMYDDYYRIVIMKDSSPSPVLTQASILEQREDFMAEIYGRLSEASKDRFGRMLEQDLGVRPNSDDEARKTDDSVSTTDAPWMSHTIDSTLCDFCDKPARWERNGEFACKGHHAGFVETQQKAVPLLEQIDNIMVSSAEELQDVGKKLKVPLPDELLVGAFSVFQNSAGSLAIRQIQNQVAHNWIWIVDGWVHQAASDRKE